MSAADKLRRIIDKRSGLLLNVVFVVVVFLAVTAFQTRNMLSASATPAPALRGMLLDGGAYDLAAVGDKPVLVYFFAPWCKICGASADNLVRLRRWRDESSLEILTVVLDWQTVSEVRDYVERHDIELPVVLGDWQVARDWQIQAFPTYYVLDRDKRVQRRDLGYSTQFGLWWRTFLVD